MTRHPERRRVMRILAVILTAAWVGIAISVASAYRPGGPVDIVVALACFAPVLVADAGVVWPPAATTHRGHVALAWIWVVALLLAIPMLYGTAVSLASGGPRSLVPSIEAAYGGALALGAMTFFSIVGVVHRRRGAEVFERRATRASAGFTVALSAVLGLGFLFVALVNDQGLREREPASSRFGPTDPDRIPPFCDQPLRLGPNALVSIEAVSSTDDIDRGRALLTGRRNGRDEAWGGSWNGPDGQGQQAYLRIGSLAWLNTSSDDPDAPGSSWQEVQPEPFDLAGTRQLTMDGPPHAVVNVPRGDIVAEDLGLEIIEGARARHCRTFMDGPAALDAFLPLRWLLADSSFTSGDALSRWRGEMDWWVFTDGELGMASVEVSGPRSSTGWSSDDVRAALEAHLEATDRDIETGVSAPFETGASFPVQVESPTPVQAGASTSLTTGASPSAAAGSAARDAAPGAGPTTDVSAPPSATPAPTLGSVAP